MHGAPPAPDVPPDAETLGVTRRQFFNRSIVALFALGLAGFGAAVLAFLWPALRGGFGVDDPGRHVDDILARSVATPEPFFYVPEGRFYINPYPSGAVSNAEAGVLRQRCSRA